MRSIAVAGLSLGFILRSVPDIKCDSDKGGCCVSGDYSAVVSALKGTREYMNSKNPGSLLTLRDAMELDGIR